MIVKVLCFPFHSTLLHKNVQVNLRTDTELFTQIVHSIYGATAPSGPWPPSQDASILLCLVRVSFHPLIHWPHYVSLQTTSSHLVLGFTTGLVL